MSMQPLHNYNSEGTLGVGFKPLSLELQKGLLRKSRRLSQDLASHRYSIASDDQYQSSQVSQLSPETLNIGRRTQLIQWIVENNIQKAFSVLTQFLDTYLKRKHFTNAFFLMTAMISLTNFFGMANQKIQLFIRIAQLFKQKKQFAKAIRILRKALEYAWLIKSNYYELLIYDKIGIVQYISGDLERADYYHNRFTQSHLQSSQSPAYIVAMENVKNVWSQFDSNKSTKFNYHMLSMSYLLPRLQNPSETLTQQFLEGNLQLSTEQKFDILQNIFLKSSEFIDKIQSIEPLQIKNLFKPEDSPSEREIRKKVDAFDKLERMRNHTKLQKKKLYKEPYQIPKCFNIHRMIEQRINDHSQPVQFEELYRQIKIKSLSLKKDDKKINLPVLISHMGKQF